jgi:hypothetical protein
MKESTGPRNQDVAMYASEWNVLLYSAHSAVSRCASQPSVSSRILKRSCAAVSRVEGAPVELLWVAFGGGFVGVGGWVVG